MDSSGSQRSSLLEYLLKTVFPMILGSILTLGGAIFTAQTSKQDRVLVELRNEYVSFMVEMDAIKDDISRYYEELYKIFDKYYSKTKFIGGTLNPEDQHILEKLENKNNQLNKRIRKSTYSILLLETKVEARRAIRNHLEKTIDYLIDCDRLAYSLQSRFNYDEELVKEFEENGTLISKLMNIEAQYSNHIDLFEDFVDTMIDDARWRE